MTKVYYMDGYHGGIRGHMDFGCWRDIVSVMNARPDWKLNLDVEPISYEYLRERDPETYDDVCRLIREGRMELTSGSYGQPYGWITDGESSIRHLVMGRAVLRDHFPDAKVETYSVQEPCWSSFYPQILRQLGYRCASLKNASTAWGGYTLPYTAENGMTADIVNWTGPDGTSIPTIPRYSCERLVNVWSTEAVAASAEWADECAENGAPHPTGMYYQDLGWGANPGVSGDHIEFTTQSEYFGRFCGDDLPSWQPGQEIFCGALPWGDQTLVKMARQVRRLEVGMLRCERLTAAASSLLTAAENSANEARIAEAWGHLLMTQHHDGWICAAAGFGENNWAYKTGCQVYAAEFLTDKINRTSFAGITESLGTDDGCEGETLTVFSFTGRRERQFIRADITADPDTRAFEVYDGDVRLNAQQITKRKHGDGSFNAGELLFIAELPATGYKTFRILPVKTEPDGEKKVHITQTDGRIRVENEVIRITIDLTRGGMISSYYDKRRGREIVPYGAAFNEFRGYFIREKRFCSNTEHPAGAKIECDGELEAVIAVRGKIADSGYTMRYTVRSEEAYADVSVDFHFADGTLIGEPFEMTGDLLRHPHRTYHDGRYRLNAYFPTVFEQKHIDKDCAYDVCRSGLEDTHFQLFGENKHNILLHWADCTDETEGLCVFADHTTAYIHGGGYDFGLALAWGYDGGFWWGRRTLRGGHSLSYRILPHTGTWREADLWHENERFLFRPAARRGRPSEVQTERSLFGCLTGGVETGAMFTKDGKLYVRVCNPGQTETCEFSVEDTVHRVTEVNPEFMETGRSLTAKNGRFTDTIVHFGIRTYRLDK